MEKILKCPGPENSLKAVPEIFECPECGAEVEIWSDERKGKCPACKKLVRGAIAQGDRKPDSPKKFTVEVKELTDDSGVTIFYERYDAIVQVSLFDHAEIKKIACEACHNYGKNFACPPYSPTFEKYLEGEKYARVLCIRMPQEYFRHIIQEKKYRECFRAAKKILDKELLDFRKQGQLIAGSGYCMGCETCAVEQGHEQCVKPDKLIYSLESLGVNLTGLTRTSFDFDLEWSAAEHAVDFVCAIGAVFFQTRPT